MKGVSSDATNEDGLTSLHQVNYCSIFDFQCLVDKYCGVLET